jgi:hypothetical protein
VDRGRTGDGGWAADGEWERRWRLTPPDAGEGAVVAAGVPPPEVGVALFPLPLARAAAAAAAVAGEAAAGGVGGGGRVAGGEEGEDCCCGLALSGLKVTFCPVFHGNFACLGDAAGASISAAVAGGVAAKGCALIFVGASWSGRRDSFAADLQMDAPARPNGGCSTNCSTRERGAWGGVRRGATSGKARLMFLK